MWAVLSRLMSYLFTAYLLLLVTFLKDRASTVHIHSVRTFLEYSIVAAIIYFLFEVVHGPGLFTTIVVTASTRAIFVSRDRSIMRFRGIAVTYC